MNEIDKLKTEHARYRAALKDIEHGVYQAEPSVIARRALNPTPVTLENILAALKKLKKLNDDSRLNMHSIRFYSDESGNLYNEADYFAGFSSLREALDILEARVV